MSGSVRPFQQRQNSLTPEDLEAITSIVESIHYNKQQNLSHDCRFSMDITPEDFKDMVETFKEVRSVLADSKTVIRRAFLGILVVVFMGLLTKGFWATVWEKLK